MATDQHQERAAQTQAELIAPFKKCLKKASAARVERVRDEQWERRIEEDWQWHLETLQQCVSELLIKNQHLRMGLMEGHKPSQR